mgnify:CR=1 FL=1
MSIQRLEIAGFRSLENVVWEPGALNVLIGQNGSGKSNLLRALQLLKSAAEGKLSQAVRASGGMAPLMWDGQAESIIFKLRIGQPDATYAYEIVMERLGQSGGFRIEKELLYRDKSTKTTKILERTGRGATIQKLPTKDVIEIKGDALKEDETLLSQTASIEVTGLPRVFISRTRGALVDSCVYHDVRVDADAEIRRAAVSRRDTQVNADGNNLVSVLHTHYTSDRHFKDEINMAMKAAFGDEFEELVFPPAEDGRVQLRVRWRSLKREQSAADLSDGTLRFLFLITVLASPEPPPLIAIDEPETGLHPSMFPLVAEHAADAARRTQVILTTHSPQFLNAFKGRADITTIAEWREGKTHLRRLPEAELAKWLEHYQLGDLMLSGELENIG